MANGVTGNEFAQGLMSGFNFVDAIRDRRRRSRLDAERLSIARATERRAQSAEQRAVTAAEQRSQLFSRQMSDLERADVDRATIEAGREAAFRNEADPDATPSEDLRLIQEAAPMDELAATFLSQRSANQRLSNELASIRGVTAAPSQPQVGPQAPAPAAAPAAAPSPAPAAAPTTAPASSVTRSPGTPEAIAESTPNPRDPSQPEQLPPDQFADAGTRKVLVSEIAYALPEADLEEITHAGTSFEQQILKHGTTEAPAGVLGEREITALPLPRQEQARRRSMEIMGVSRQEAIERAQFLERARKGVVEKWHDVLDLSKESEMRQLAETDPNEYIMRYTNIRGSIRDENARNQLDKRAMEVADAALPQLTEIAQRLMPVNADGLPDVSSPEGQKIVEGLNRNVALRRKVQGSFNLAEEAGLRGSVFPIGNQELVDSTVAAIKKHGASALPMTVDQERAALTQMRRAVANQGARRAPMPQIKALASWVNQGYIDVGEAEQFLKTGTFSAPTTELVSHPVDQDLFITRSDGTTALVRPARAPIPDVPTLADKFDMSRQIVQDTIDQFERYYDPELFGTKRHAEMADAFLNWGTANREELLNVHNIDFFTATPNERATLLKRFVEEHIDLRNVYENAWYSWIPIIGPAATKLFGPKDFDEKTLREREAIAEAEGVRLTEIPRSRTLPSQAETIRARLRNSQIANNPQIQAILDIEDPVKFAEAIDRLRESQ